MLRNALHRFLPSHFHHPFGLAKRIIRSGDPHARFAMSSAAAGAALTPLDLVLQPFEHRRYRAAPPPGLPALFICGPPRSGTTLLFQVLAANLPVAFFNNLTSWFPRSPITANAWFGKGLRYHPGTYGSYYGRARSLAAPNDALYLWDRWVGRDRKAIPDVLHPSAQEALRRFLGAFEAYAGAPLVAKNNSLIGYAHLVAEVVPRAGFVCLTREPLFLAQALLIARRDIHGDERVPYGLAEVSVDDPVGDVIRQVRFHQRLLREQRERLGSRFRVLTYESLCANPAGVVQEIAEQMEMPVNPAGLLPAAFEVSRRTRVEPAVLERLKAEL
jgi:hypothetical protein